VGYVFFFCVFGYCNDGFVLGFIVIMLVNDEVLFLVWLSTDVM